MLALRLDSFQCRIYGSDNLPTVRFAPPLANSSLRACDHTVTASMSGALRLRLDQDDWFSCPCMLYWIPTVPQRMLYTDLKVNGCTYSGFVQITIGILSLIFGSVSAAVGCHMTSVRWPLWGGAFFIATGFVGTRVAKRVSQAHFVRHLTSFAGIIALNMLVAVCQAAMDEEAAMDGSKDVKTPKTVRVAIDCVLAFLSSAEIATAIWAGVITFLAIHKMQKQRSMLASQPYPTTYNTMGSTAILSSPYPGAGYLPIDTQPPPKYETLPPRNAPPSYDDSQSQQTYRDGPGTT
ncbi:hypothetical protein BSL78_20495 [Apostichopus japonicus]|uniref:Transmembrane protein n=1 Tax=Stichopus japonicus TaxID=307972 RepID=A0A2G8K3W3_STIJA|nr:hypothetical protein BSL78_20495 [Apostichopus japonicus]